MLYSRCSNTPIVYVIYKAYSGYVVSAQHIYVIVAMLYSKCSNTPIVYVIYRAYSGYVVSAQTHLCYSNHDID